VRAISVSFQSPCGQVRTGSRRRSGEATSPLRGPGSRRLSQRQRAAGRHGRGPFRCAAALLCDDDDDAEHLYGRALDAHGEAGRPFERARTELAFGEFLRRSRRRVEAREHLRAAVDRFDALGALQWVERARAELRASGQTARRRDPSTRDELTAQELQIAGLVAGGLSNRETVAQLFLSPRTVDFHLRNIFRKLEITSRIQLAQLELEPARRTPSGSAEPVAGPVRA
jgi:DNA-binding CsgD family transcriptional regulator